MTGEIRGEGWIAHDTVLTPEQKIVLHKASIALCRMLDLNLNETDSIAVIDIIGRFLKDDGLDYRDVGDLVVRRLRKAA